MAFRIVVDSDLCQGHGVCENEAPELFEVSRDMLAHVLVEQADESQRRAAEAAAKYCPTHAITLVPVL